MLSFRFINYTTTFVRCACNLVFILSFFSLTTWASTADLKSDTEKSVSPSEVKLLVLGDSLSAGYGLLVEESWVHLLQQLWLNEHRNITIVNASISGETTDGGLARLPRLLQQHSPTHVLIELGANDGLQGHAINKMQSNLFQIVSLVKKVGATAIIQDMEIPPNYGKRYNTMFANSFEKIAGDTSSELIPFFLADIALKNELMQKDKLHPNATAQPIIAEFMKKQLTPLLKLD